MRAAGGLLIMLGVLLVFVRRSGGRWSDFELLLVLAVPAAALFGLAVGRAGTGAGERAESWRGVLLVAAVILSLLALLQFLTWAGASTHHLLYDAAVLVATALIAAAGARRTRAPYVMFLAGLALLGAWMLVWIKVFPDPSGNTVRWLLLGGGMALLLTSVAADLGGAIGAGELGTAGALGLVAAGILGVFVSVFSAAFLGLVFTSSGSNGDESPIPPVLGGHLAGAQTTGWDIYLLAVSVVLLVTAARTRRRGLGYVGALGVLLFLISAAVQLERLSSGHGPTHTLLGWPLVLLLLGVAGLAAPLLRRRTA